MNPVQQQQNTEAPRDDQILRRRKNNRTYTKQTTREICEKVERMEKKAFNGKEPYRGGQ